MSNQSFWCRSLAVIAASLVIAACSETRTTAPMARTAAEAASFDFSNPPPPPIDTASETLVDGGTFGFRTQYFLNPVDLNGWITFPTTQPAGVSATPNARISFHRGVVSGKGTVHLTGPIGTLTIDLATGISSDGAQFNLDCANGCASLPFHALLTTKGRSTPIDGVLQIGVSPTSDIGPGNFVPGT